jgi:CDP-6-deoxy-D-xylo-4-hexulose-3-dehydrase
MLGERALKPGDEVITCATGFPTTVNPSLQNGLVPVFVDVDIPTYNINVRKIEAADLAEDQGDHARPHLGQSLRSRRHHGGGRKA